MLCVMIRGSQFFLKPHYKYVCVCRSVSQDIKDLEEFRAKNQRLQKLWVGRLLFYSSMLYLLTCLGIYFCYLPDEWVSRLVMALPLLAFPVL